MTPLYLSRGAGIFGEVSAYCLRALSISPRPQEKRGQAGSLNGDLINHNFVSGSYCKSVSVAFQTAVC